MNESTIWLRCNPAAAHPRFRLFCLPHAGGGTLAFSSWKAALPSSVQLCSVLLPGRETRSAEPFFTEIDPLVDAIDQELRPWLDTPYALFGHSMGSLLAFEWARRLQRDGYPKPAWLFLSGRRAPDLPGETTELQSLPDQEFLEALNRRYDGIPKAILQNPDFMEVILPILRADIAIVESYRFREDEPLDTPITVFAGMKDPSVTYNSMLAWGAQTSNRFAAQVFPGGHFYPQEPLLKTIAATLNELHDKQAPLS